MQVGCSVWLRPLSHGMLCDAPMRRAEVYPASNGETSPCGQLEQRLHREAEFEPLCDFESEPSIQRFAHRRCDEFQHREVCLSYRRLAGFQ